MGTRNLTAVFYKGEYRIAQYGQWDGYPDGQGITTLEFLRDHMDFDKFTGNLMKLRDMTPEDGAEIDKVREWPKVYPHLSRDAGAKVLQMVQEGPDGMLIERNINFAGESLFCEWAYVIDFDKGTFEAFKGFNKQKLDPSERFAGIPLDDTEYQQVKFVTSWRLDALPTNEKFLKELEPAEADEAA